MRALRPAWKIKISAVQDGYRFVEGTGSQELQAYFCRPRYFNANSKKRGHPYPARRRIKNLFRQCD
jgi:hypothetical protein